MQHLSTFTVVCSLFTILFTPCMPITAMQVDHDVTITLVNQTHKMLSVCIPTLCTHITDPKIEALQAKIKDCWAKTVLIKNAINNLQERAQRNDYDFTTLQSIIMAQSELALLEQEKVMLDDKYTKMNAAYVQNSQDTYRKLLHTTLPRKKTIKIAALDVPETSRIHVTIPANNQKVQAVARTIRARLEKDEKEQAPAISVLGKLRIASPHKTLSPHMIHAALQHPARGITKKSFKPLILM